MMNRSETNDSSKYIRAREHSVAELRRRLYTALFSKYVLIFLIGWLFLWGAAVLVLRVADLVPWSSLFLGGFGLFLVPILAMHFTRRKIPSQEVLCATLDRENAAGGLVLSSLEAELDSWGTRIVRLSVPEVKWENKKSLTTTLLAVLFVSIAFLLPDSTIVAEYRRPLDIEDQVNQLKGQLQTLEEEKLLEVEMVESIKSNIERIQKEADGMGPVKTLDALDHLSNRLKQEAEKAAEEGLREAETLSKAEALTKEVQNQAENFSPQEQEEIMQGLAEMLNEMLGENPELFEKLAGMCEGGGSDDSSKNGDGKEGKMGQKELGTQKLDSETLKKMLQNQNLQGLTPEQMEQLQKAMQECRECNKEMLQRLKEGGMIDPELLEQLRELDRISEEELEKLLAELGCCGDGECDCEGECEGHCPGRGGISRGRADAPITFDDDEASEDGTGFKPQILPPPALEELRNSLKIGSSRTSPSLNPDGTGGDQGGVLQGGETGTGSAHGHTILPQHRGPTGRYFERN